MKRLWGTARRTSDAHKCFIGLRICEAIFPTQAAVCRESRRFTCGIGAVGMTVAVNTKREGIPFGGEVSSLTMETRDRRGAYAPMFTCSFVIGWKAILNKLRVVFGMNVNGKRDEFRYDSHRSDGGTMIEKRNAALRIAMLGHKRIPSREGGVEIVVEELATRMAARGHQVTCYNRRGHHTGGKALDAKRLSMYKGVHLKWVPTIDRRGFAAMSSSFFAAFKAAFGRYDVVHFHAEGPCAMLWLPKLFGKRCIATIHGLDYQRSKWGRFARAYILFGEKCAVKYADEIIVLSEGMGRYFRQTYGRETRFIPNGVTRPEKKDAQQIKDFGLKKDEYVLFLGRIVPEKGIRYLIEAFKQLETEKKLVIAGGSSDTDDFMKEIKFSAGDDARIVFTGFIQGRLLEELYSNAFFYVLPSDVEGMPLSLLEAMSYGNCCLVSNIVECTEVIEDRGVSFQRGDIEDLRQKMQMLLNDDAKVRRYKKGAANFICAKYKWEETVTRTLNCYMAVDEG